jgi:hypothetical protein
VGRTVVTAQAMVYAAAAECTPEVLERLANHLVQGTAAPKPSTNSVPPGTAYA